MTSEYNLVPVDGSNIFREKFGHLSDEQWRSVLINAIAQPSIEGVEFPAYPKVEIQNQMHGNAGEIAISEICEFYRFIKANTYGQSDHHSRIRMLDFGSGWGRVIRPFLRDFEFSNIYGFEPNFSYCVLARTLNPYVSFFSGDFVPRDNIPQKFFNLVIGWSIFSHLSFYSASLWLAEMARILEPGGWCVFTTWGDRFLERLKKEADQRAAGEEIHWYSAICIDAAGSIDDRLEDFRRGQFVWFTNGQSTLYGEAFVSEMALDSLLKQNRIPFEIEKCDTESLSQDVFVLKRL